MRAALVTVTLVLLAGILWVMATRSLPVSVADTCGCPHARVDHPEVAKKKPPVPITNRFWQNKTPKDGRDLTFHMVLFDKAKIRAGAMAHLSEWRYYVDRVRFSVKGDTLTVESPQDRTKTKYTVRTWRCKGEAPKPFDLCLELKKGGKKVTLYSDSHTHFAEGETQRLLQRAAHTGPDAPECSGHCEDVAPEWFELLAE